MIETITLVLQLATIFFLIFTIVMLGRVVRSLEATLKEVEKEVDKKPNDSTE